MAVERKTELSLFTPAIVAICKRTLPMVPAWLTPNQVTVLSFLPTVAGGLCLYLAGYNQAWFVPAVLLAFFHCYADNLDGLLARARNLTSERGFFLDITLDAFGYVAVFLGIGLSSYAHLAPFACYLILILLREVVLLEEVLLRRAFVMPVPGPSEIPFALAGLCLLAVLFPGASIAVRSVPLCWFDLGAIVFGLVSGIDLLVAVVRMCRLLPGPAGYS